MISLRVSSKTRLVFRKTGQLRPCERDGILGIARHLYLVKLRQAQVRESSLDVVDDVRVLIASTGQVGYVDT